MGGVCIAPICSYVRARTSGPQGITAGVTLQHAAERIAMASEIAELPDLTAYVALAGAQPTVLVNLTPRDLPEVTAAMEE